MDKYVTDPIARAYWETAWRFLRQVKRDRDLRQDDFAVVQLRGMLTGAYEHGVKHGAEQKAERRAAKAARRRAEVEGRRRAREDE